MFLCESFTGTMLVVCLSCHHVIRCDAITALYECLAICSTCGEVKSQQCGSTSGVGRTWLDPSVVQMQNVVRLMRQSNPPTCHVV